MRGSLCFALLLLASCGGGSWSPRGPAYRADVMYGAPAYEGALGSAERVGDVWEVVIAQHPFDTETLRALIAHELGHTRGLGHSLSPTCIMFETIHGDAVLCPDSVEGASLYGPEPTTVRVLDGDLRDDVEAAVALWNAAAERVLFQVEALVLK